ncbi:hypothetical protein K439DRAFT_1665668 [Ramaria rubella]|nr:hypothetical protein K439DRAFT_1665668 [Ramaria rubella]
MPALIPIDNTWGAVLMGVFVGVFPRMLTLHSDHAAWLTDWALSCAHGFRSRRYGIATVYMYYQRYPNDNLYLKGIVGTIWTLDTVHTVFVTHMVYTYLVTGFGDYNALAGNIWSFNMHVFLTTVVACVVQTFFVHRCWKLDRGMVNTALSIFILLVALVQLVFGLISTVLTFRLHEFVQFLKFTWTVDTWLGAAATCDILVSAAIVRSLWRSRTGIKRTNNLIMNLILWTVNTGVLTSVWAILDIALFTASKDTLIHDFFNVMLAKLYANTLLATLNHRRPTVRDDEDSYQKNISLSHVSHSRPFGRETEIKTQLSGVHITTHTIQDATDEPPSPTLKQRPEPQTWQPSAEGKTLRWVDDDGSSVAVAQ